jgi:hypothetical protein
MLTQIQITNGYRTNLGQSVFWIHPNPIEYKKDCIVYCDDSEQFSDRNTLRLNELEIIIDCYLWNKEAIGYGVASSNAIADLIRAIGLLPTLGISGNILHLKESNNTVELEGSSCVKRTLVLSLDYETERWGI